MSHRSSNLTRAGLAMVCAGFFLFGAIADADAPSLPQTLVTPARLSPRAGEGLFTAVARAGPMLVAVGEQGRIMRSADNGLTWRQVECPTSVTLTGVAFADSQHGWVIGQMGVVLRTADGGASWSRVLDGNTANTLLLNAAQADLLAQKNSAAAKANLQAAQQFVAGGPSVPFLGLQAVSAQDIVIGGAFGMAFESRDGGTTWAAIFDAIPNPNGLNIYHFVAMGNALYLIGEQGFLAVRNQAGVFAGLSSPAQGTLFGGVATPGGRLLVYGLQGSVLWSSDAGAHWSAPVSGTQVGIDTGIVRDDGAIVLGDLSGALLLSKDNGQSFSLSKVDEPVAGLAEAADKSLIVAGPFGLRRIPPAVPGA